MTPQPKEQDDELDALCRIFSIFPDELDDYLPNHVGRRHVEKVLAWADSRAAERETAGRQREAVLLDALAGMYEQYCNGKHGHNFMGAGERAIEVLEDYGVHDEAREWNDRSGEELEKALNTLKGSDQ